MSMNIGPMLRAMLGDAAPVDGSRTLELRIGQIVRGVLLEMLDGGEGLLNIGGVHVRAKLEADLPVGQGMLLQVQPGSNGGVIRLKPLSDASADLPEEGLKDVLKSFGLPDQKWSGELLRGLKRDSYPIGKETASYFQAAGSLKPAGTDMASWMGAADVAFRRGLPASEPTIASLRQALFGKPLQEELTGLAAVLESWQEGAGAKSPQLTALTGRVQQLLAEGERLLSQGESQLLGSSVPTAPGTGTDEGKQPPHAGNPPTVPVADGKPAAPGGQAVNASAAPVSPDSAVEPDHPRSSGRTPAGETPLAAGPRSAGLAAAGATADHSRDADKASESAQAPTSGQIAGTAAAPRQESPWLGRFLQWLGAGHEHRLLNGAAAGPDLPAAALLGAPGGESSAVERLQSTADSLKSALLSLAGHQEAPQELRDAAHSLVSQITGQQLLLSSERQPDAPFSLMTLFVPMKGQDGDTTATVHVQTRRSRRGEWDTDNCRLLFDLRMRHLGDTIVDVQVVDRIVSVKLMNDFPGMPKLADQAREELSTGLQAAGFQLLSVTALPLPDIHVMSGGDAGDKTDKTDARLASAFAAKPYKGVDFRV